MTMYTDYFLKFADEAEANGVLFEGETPKYTAIDVIGTIYKETGDTLMGSGGSVPALEKLPGWHVNVRHMGEAPELDAYKVDVKTPARMWA